MSYPQCAEDWTVKNKMEQSMESLISIVLPIYNGEKYMRKSIDSVLAQTYANWELLIIDDGSTDNTTIIRRSMRRRITAFVIIKTLGISVLRGH